VGDKKMMEGYAFTMWASRRSIIEIHLGPGH